MAKKTKKKAGRSVVGYHIPEDRPPFVAPPAPAAQPEIPGIEPPRVPIGARPRVK